MTPAEKRRDTISVLSLMLLIPASFMLFSVFGPLRLAQAGLNERTIGLIVMLPGIFVVCGCGIAARLANSSLRKWALLLVGMLQIIIGLLMAYASSVAGFVIAYILFGVGSVLFWTNCLSTSFRVFANRPNEQARFQGKVTLMQGLGSASGPVLGGLLNAWRPNGAFWVCVALGAVGMIFAALLTRSRAIEPSLGLKKDIAVAYRRQWHVLTARPQVLMGTAFVFLACFSTSTLSGSFLGTYALSIGLTSSLIAYLAAGKDLVSAILRNWFGAFHTRFGARRLMVFSAILCTLIGIAVPFVKSWHGVLAVYLFTGAGFAMVPPAANMLGGASNTPREQAFGITAMNSSSWFVPTLMAPVTGAMITGLGYKPTYLILGGFWLLLIGAASVWSRSVSTQNEQLVEHA